MDLISIIVVLIVVGLVLWLIQTYLPIAEPLKTIIAVLLVLVVCIWLLQSVGFVHLR